MALRTLTARARSSLLHEASPAPCFSPPATRVSSTTAPGTPFFSAPAVMSRGTTAPPASMLQKSRAYSYPAFNGGSLIKIGVWKKVFTQGTIASPASVLQTSRTYRAFNGGSLVHIRLGQKVYSTMCLLTDPQDIHKLLAMQANTLLMVDDCLVEIKLVYDLRVLTISVIGAGIVVAFYVGKQMIERGTEVLGQLGQHYPEIFKSILGEIIFQLNIPFVGKGNRFVLKDYWFNKPSESIKRYQERLALDHGQRLREQYRLQKFHDAEEERRLDAQKYIVAAEARKKMSDEKIRERLEAERRKSRGSRLLSVRTW